MLRGFNRCILSGSLSSSSIILRSFSSWIYFKSNSRVEFVLAIPYDVPSLTISLPMCLIGVDLFGLIVLPILRACDGLGLPSFLGSGKMFGSVMKEASPTLI